MHKNDDFRILMVDDDIQMLSLNERLLNNAGYLVQTAMTGAECMSKMYDFRPNLLLLDIMLPDANGMELCRQIKDDPILCSSYIILISGIKTGTDDISGGLETGADSFMVKPFVPREFLAWINAARRIVMAENMLRLSEQRFRNLFDHSTVGKSITDLEGKITVNKAFCNIVGYSPEELQQKTWYELTHPDDVERDKQIMQSIVRREIQSHRWEKRYLTKTGGIVWCDVSSTLERNEKGDPLYFITNMTDITLRKNIEEDFLKKNTFIQTVLDNLPMGIAMNEIDKGTATYINKQFEKVYGWPAKELEDVAGFFTKVYPDEAYRNELVTRIMADIGSGDPLKMHWENCIIRHKDGSQHVVNAVNIPLFEQNIMVSTAMDVTEINSKETELKQSETRFKLLIENSPDAITLIDSDGKFKYISNSAFKMFGFTKEEISEYSPDKLTHPDDLPAVLEILGEIHQHPEKIITCQYRFRHKDNSWRWIESTFTNLLAEPAVNALAINFHDITDRKRSEKIQQIQLNIAKAALTSANLKELLSITKDQLSSLIDTTNFFIAFYREETRTLHELIWIDEIDDFGEWPAENSLSGRVVTTRSTLLLTREEIDRIALENGLILFGNKAACWLRVPLVSNDKVVGAMVVQSYTDPNAYDSASAGLMEMIAHELGLYISRDIGHKELIAAKERAELSDKLKSSFLANMSHEIRTPMNSIVGFADILTEHDLTPDERDKYAEIVKSRSDDLLHIINDILDISRIESGDATVDKSEVELNEMFDAVQTVIMEKIRSANKPLLSVHCKNPFIAGNDTFFSDPYIIRQILFNLLDNALKFTTTGTISFGCDLPENGMITFFVSDTGIGIAPENQEVIFKTFMQADISDHHTYGGTGLGLAICKGSAELLGGKIWVESTPGKGSTFFFSVPFEQNRQPITQKDEKPGVVPGKDLNAPEEYFWPGKRIVVVEDEPANMEFLRIVLAQTGADLIYAWNGRDLRNIYPKLGTIDLVLLDLRLPDSNGWDLAREIKALRKELPVIAQTAFAMSGDREKCFAAGCDNYLAKPISKHDLLQMISCYL